MVLTWLPTCIAEQNEAHRGLNEPRDLSFFWRRRLIARRGAKESLAILKRLDEGAHHLCSLRAIERLCIVAHVIAWLAERIQFGQPEIVTAEVSIKRVV